MSNKSSSEPDCLANHFLMAMPGMADPNFDETLILLAEHNAEGAMGLILNRTMPFDLGSLFQRIDLTLPDKQLAAQPVLSGGPVQSDRGFVLHREAGQWQATIQISRALSLTSSRDILESMAQEAGPTDVVVTLGYAGWAPGQLEAELAQNAWLSVQADANLIFDLPLEQRLGAAFGLLGVDPTLLHGAAGHA